MKYLSRYLYVSLQHFGPRSGPTNFGPELWTGAKLFDTLMVLWYDVFTKRNNVSLACIDSFFLRCYRVMCHDIVLRFPNMASSDILQVHFENRFPLKDI